MHFFGRLHRRNRRVCVNHCNGSLMTWAVGHPVVSSLPVFGLPVVRYQRHRVVVGR